MSQAPFVQKNVDLAGKNSLRVSARAHYFVSAKSAGELRQALQFAEDQSVEVLILGGGSNLVFAGDFAGLVIEISTTGRRWQDINGDEATLDLGAGENWHDAVLYAAKAGYRGIENLALIPGTAGAAPVQNIGAYGVELKDSLVDVTAFDRKINEEVSLSAGQCEFAYRDSLFKRNPGRYVILRIRLRLSRKRPLNVSYKDLSEYLGDCKVESLSPLDVAEAVMAVRRRKLPDPVQLPNAGSFFKNPVVSRSAWHSLAADYPDMVGYPIGDTHVKLAAAWLIDRCGWKGYRTDRVGVHNRQALVLVNHSGGSGKDILALASMIKADVKSRFGVELEMEPGVVGG